jgi:PhoPQ-activated pathogenicity-related protein
MMRTQHFFLAPLLLTGLLTGCQTQTIRTASPSGAKKPVPTPKLAKVVPRDMPLDKYISHSDSTYRWTPASAGEFDPGDGDTNLRLVSQTWQGKKWTHRLQILQPTKLRHPGAAILNISFGSGSLPETFVGKALADATGAVVVNVFDVPNQPLFDRTEDDLIAYSFGKYIETGDASWPLLFPMTKAVVKTMDALGEWSKKEGQPEINKFIVSGGSKRGWTTDLVAAVDERVIGAIPIVYNNLNLVAQIDHQREVWKEISSQMEPYAKAGLFQEPRPQRVKELAAMVDPWTYRARLTMPKLFINATNDAYWPHDAGNLYLGALPGQTNVFYVPNAPHTLNESGTAAIGSAAAWSRLVLEGKKVPSVKLTAEKSEEGRRFAVTTEGAPTSVKLWIAASKTKDFREATWKPLAMDPWNGAYRVRVPETKLFANGAKYAAAFGEIEIPSQLLPLRLSSEMWESE